MFGITIAYRERWLGHSVILEKEMEHKKTDDSAILIISLLVIVLMALFFITRSG